MLIDEIIEPIANELTTLEKHIDELLHSNTPLVNEVVQHINGKRGKRLRSSAMLLIGKLLGEVNDKLINYAAMLEVLHTATLIHDDVVDAATERRGIPSINTK
jgi:octaprenyl-diphosphate synthase